MGTAAKPISFLGAEVGLTIAGFFVNSALFFLALLITHQLTTKLFSQKVADTSVLLLAFCPAGIFYSSIYPESLYLLLLVISFYCLEIEKVYSSGLVGYLAGLTRPEGIFTAVPLLVKGRGANGSPKQKKKAIIASLVAVASLLTVLFLAWIITGNPFVVLSAEIGWDRVTLTQAFLQPAKILAVGFLEFWIVSISMIAISVFVIVSFFVKNRANLQEHRLLPYYSYAAILLVFFLLVADIKSLARYFCAFIPVYWSLGLWVEKKPQAKIWIFALFAAQLVIGAALFAAWYPYV
jgi:Gpi18-like mannosyltransferase